MIWQQQSFFAAAAVGWAFCHMGFLREYRPPENDRASAQKFYVPSSLAAANENVAKHDGKIAPQAQVTRKDERARSAPAASKSPLQSEAESTPDMTTTSALAPSEIFADDMAQPALKLYQNAPNPFRAQMPNSATLIRFDWPGPHLGEVELVVYDVIGQPVRRLFRGEQASGSHVVSWDGKNNDGELVPPGKYWYRIKTASRMFSKMLVVAR